MKKFSIAILAATTFAAVLVHAAQEGGPAAAISAVVDHKNPLVWDAMEKTVSPAPGDTTANFQFWFTNTATTNISILSVYPGCGCTTANVPPMPWKIDAGTNGVIPASVDLKGKSGVLSKTITVNSSGGQQTLTLKIIMPKDPVAAMADRQRNIEMAKTDKQAVFKNDCARCHFTPVVGRTDGEEIYLAACAICHEPHAWAKASGKENEPHERNEMVPDLAALKNPTSKQFWKITVANGNNKPGTLMPAFSKRNGGPLDDAQMDALVEYLMKRFPHDPSKSAKAELTKPQSKAAQ